MKELRLPLTRQWFDLTKAGIKTEDYREITPYWCSRVMLYKGKHKTVKWWLYMSTYEGWNFMGRLASGITYGVITFKPFVINTMPLGYPKATDTSRILRLEHKGIEIGTGNPEWGAEPDKLYFVIKHGLIL